MKNMMYLEKSKKNNLLWKDSTFDHFIKIVSDENFPCLFAKKSVKTKSFHYGFCSYNEEKKEMNYVDFLHSLLSYTDFVKKTDIKERLLVPLIVFFEFSSERSQHDIAWDAINWVHLNDPVKWPEHIPMDPNNPNWCFCFNDVELFINISSNAHSILKSRNLGRNLTLVINPRKNFDVVANQKTGGNIRQKIRDRVKEYNNGFIPTELGFYGDGTSKEWEQYQLEEQDLQRPLKCPFHHK